MIIKAIPTNIITGFLGVGKTSLIKQLLATKPAGETWAVLVNEFGEVGIDAGLLNSAENGIQIREVSGGCMCCAAGVPTQVAINQLIAKAKPDRLLIEPTGLGHPNEIIKVLSAAHYQNVISLRSTLCLVDARKIHDPRYREHANFIQQLQVADVIIATKSDLYDAENTKLLYELQTYLSHIERADIPVVSHTNQQSLPRALLDYLNQPRRVSLNTSGPTGVNPKLGNLAITTPSLLRTGGSHLSELGLFADGVMETSLAFDKRGMVRKQNRGEGCFSCGWVFEPTLEFDFEKLIAFIQRQSQSSNMGQALLRLKAVMITSDGIAGFNWIDHELSVLELDDTLDSRLEIITVNDVDWDEIEQQLMACFNSRLFN
ncbi:cobalamin biosynthesis protein CobW [Shewanella morhuae]|uniref:Cobalamin biosynthesis protein CobW n=1 Tax=Shewanella morhuae TaxID=365591 RepID=A0ABX5HRY2_9GAMM|nr:GTP-binding protein [Shewanella morhuae]PTA49626.1 cobalamin biosynthesis protein CobW [Shewanella morhuae]